MVMMKEKQYPKIIREVLNDIEVDHILPFLWLHGERETEILEEIDRISECGIKSFCVESRPHPDFLGDRWWKDMDLIVETAKQRNMKIWILDDQHFPTGYANGAYKEYPEKAKIYLAEFHMDLIGPANSVSVITEGVLTDSEEILGIHLCERENLDTGDLKEHQKQNIEIQYHDGVVSFDLPKGIFRLFIFYTTRTGGGEPFYINLLDKNSVRVLIDTVYETHYDHYKKEFGKTIAGFFSDEPSIGNTKGCDFGARLGTPGLKLPWSKELEQKLQTLWGDDYTKNFAALWYEYGEKTYLLRYEFMDQVTMLVQASFSEQLGKWCKQHAVQYIGHVIEDNNAHGRLGCSTGHYFRTLSGQDMSGIDVVSQQIMPGFTGKVHQWIAAEEDGEFFHFCLPRLGSSLACLDPQKKGRAMCEIFGAYGWGESIELMKWLTDHMLVNGINVFVPHAFSPRFPDSDCPPHFYAKGCNPQYRFFVELMKYMNRMSHLFQNGRRITEVAVLYHAESEWSGAKTMLSQKVARILAENQIDCDIVPIDYLDRSEFQNGKMYINGYEYEIFIIPYCERIPDSIINFVRKAWANNVKVLVVDRFPEKTIRGNHLPEEFRKKTEIVSIENLEKTIINTRPSQFCLERKHKDLRAMGYEHHDNRVYLFFNESITQTIETGVSIRNVNEEKLYLYDGFENRCKPLVRAESKNNMLPAFYLEKNMYGIQLWLQPGESVVLIEGEGCEVENTKTSMELLEEIPLNLEWNISCSENGKDFQQCLQTVHEESLPNLNGYEYFSRFSGTFRYESAFWFEKNNGERLVLEFPEISDCAEIFLNQCYVGNLFSNGHYTDISNYIMHGKNHIVIQVTNTLAWEMRDRKTAYMQMKATGMLKAPIIKRYGTKSAEF